jgi:hypothetical protein
VIGPFFVNFPSSKVAKEEVAKQQGDEILCNPATLLLFIGTNYVSSKK